MSTTSRSTSGRPLTLNFKLEATEIEEEITSLEAAPLIDGRSAKSSFVVDGDLLRHAPLTRDFGIDRRPGARRRHGDGLPGP